jgi:hypothetical protein
MVGHLTNLIRHLPDLFDLALEILCPIIVLVLDGLILLLGQLHHLMAENLHLVNDLLEVLGHIEILLLDRRQLLLSESVDALLELGVEHSRID